MKPSKMEMLLCPSTGRCRNVRVGTLHPVTALIHFHARTGMVGCGVAADFGQLLAARCLTGVGSALQNTGAQLFLADISTSENRAQCLGTNQALSCHTPSSPKRSAMCDSSLTQQQHVHPLSASEFKKGLPGGMSAALLSTEDSKAAKLKGWMSMLMPQSLPPAGSVALRLFHGSSHWRRAGRHVRPQVIPTLRNHYALIASPGEQTRDASNHNFYGEFLIPAAKPCLHDASGSRNDRLTNMWAGGSPCIDT